MKKLIFSLLVLGLLSASHFPESIEGTDLYLYNEVWDGVDGEAVYKDYDDTIEVWAITEPKSQEWWNDWEPQYNTGGAVYGITSENGINYYYQCDIDYEENPVDSGEYVPYSYCWVDAYYPETFYKINVYMDYGTEEEALDLAIAVHQGLIPKDEPPPEDEPDPTVAQDPCCPAVFLILLTAIGAFAIKN